MKIRYDQINVYYKIHLHLQTSEMIYTDLLQATLNVSNLQTRGAKLEGHLK